MTKTVRQVADIKADKSWHTACLSTVSHFIGG